MAWPPLDHAARMTLYAITDRRSVAGDLLEAVARILALGVDRLQVREKDLLDADLLALARAIRALPNPKGTRILINSRLDVAVAAGLDGVHLPSDAPPVGALRAVAPTGFEFGVSCHRADEVERAEREGADFAVFGPVFDTPSKRGFGPPTGLDALREVCGDRRIPVLALGGVTVSNAADCIAAGAAGVAGISLFLSPDAEALCSRG